jgi:elongation factor P
MKASSIRRGNVIMFNNSPHRVMDFYHHTPGNLRAMVQVKMRNLLSGAQTETKFSSTEELIEADVVTVKATFLYAEGEEYHFMYTDTYDQVSVNKEAAGDSIYYLQEQMECDITSYNGEPIGVNVAPTTTLTVVDTEPELKGATASNSPKPARTDTGLQLSVPAFVKIGDKIIVNTMDGSYLKRAE